MPVLHNHSNMERGYTSIKQWGVGVLLTITLLMDTVIPQQYQQPPLVITPRDMRLFQDTEFSMYFRYFQLDPANEYLYVGARKYVYRLRLSDISSKFERSSILTASSDDVDHCLSVTGRNRAYDCSNHVRSILFEEDSIYVCGTGAYSPREYRLNKTTLARISTGAYSSGVGKCPYAPDHEATSMYIKSGNPEDKAAMYFATATDPIGDLSHIYRPDIGNNFVRTIPWDSKWLNKPSFVGSFEVGEFIYFFYREQALETQNCGKEIFSRVARICKKDRGGMTTLRMTWTTYLKARLNCSIGGEFPYYFNHLRDVQYVNITNRFYALFTTSPTGFYGSAVCEFSLEAIERAFAGTFKQQLQSNMLWTATPVSDIPNPQPGQCIDDSRNLPDAVCQFLESRPLMDTAVASESSSSSAAAAAAAGPVYQRAGVLYTHMVMQPDVNGFMVLFLATADGVLHKVVQYVSGGQLKSKVLAEWKVTDDENRLPIRRLQLHNQRLYVAQDYQVVQYSVGQCRSYTNCTHCIQDPYCGWHIEQDTCVDYEKETSILQDVNTENALIFCNTHCRVDNQTIPTQVRVPGDSVQLSCRSRCVGAGDAARKWHVFSDDSNTYQPLVFLDGTARTALSNTELSNAALSNAALTGGAGTYLTHDGALVLTNVTAKLDLRCQMGRILIAEHLVTVPECRDAECLWREEFLRWCNAFDTYTKEFNEWLCLKKNCVSNDSCMPTTLSGQCVGT